MSSKTDRNRRMLADFEAGHSLERLGADHALSHVRVRAVLGEEKNRRRVSPDPFYSSMRQA